MPLNIGSHIDFHPVFADEAEPSQLGLFPRIELLRGFSEIWFRTRCSVCRSQGTFKTLWVANHWIDKHECP